MTAFYHNPAKKKSSIRQRNRANALVNMHNVIKRAAYINKDKHVKHFIIKYILYPYIDLSFFLGRSLYNMRMQNLIKYMLQVRDFWRGFNLKHKLVDVLTIAVLAVLSGGETWDDMELYGKDRHSLLKKFFELPVGIPSHDTFNRVFSLLTPKSLETVSFTWSAPLLAAAGFLSLKSR